MVDRPINTLLAGEGALPITNGGTGAITAAQARINLGLGTVATINLSGNAGEVLKGDGSWGVGGGGGAPGGALTQIQFHDTGGVLGGDDSLTWDKVANVLANPSGKVVIGHTAPVANGFLSRRLQVHSTDATISGVTLGYWANNLQGAYWDYIKSRGTSPGVHGIIQSGDIFGGMFWNADDGVNYLGVAGITANHDTGTPAAGSVSGNIIFSTRAAGAGQFSAERMRLRGDAFGHGQLLIGTTTDFLFPFDFTMPQILIANRGGFDYTNIAFGTFDNNASGTRFVAMKSRSTTIGGQGAVLSGDEIKAEIYYASDGVNFKWTAAERIKVDGAVALNSVPSRYEWSTTKVGETFPVERMRLDNSGRLTNGGAAFPYSVWGEFAGWTFFHTPTQVGNVSLQKYTASAGGTELLFSKSRSGVIGTNTALVDGDGIAFLGFFGADGGAMQWAASIDVKVDGTPTLNTSTPGRIQFSTTPAGGGSAIERMRIGSNGGINIGGGANNGTLFSVIPRLQVESPNGDWLARFATIGTGFVVSNAFTRTRGTSADNHVALQSGDDIGNLLFYGSDGSTFRQAGIMGFQIEGTVASNNLPSLFHIATKTNGHTFVQDRLVIHEAGYSQLQWISTNTAGVFPTLRLTQMSFGQPVAGFGARLDFEVTTGNGTNNEIGAAIDCVLADATAAAERFTLDFNIMRAGTLFQGMRLKTTFGADLEIGEPNGDINRRGSIALNAGAEWVALYNSSNRWWWESLNHPMQFDSNGDITLSSLDLIRLNGTGVVVGGSAIAGPTSLFNVIQGTTPGPYIGSFHRYGANGFVPSFAFSKSRSATPTGFGIVAQDDALGSLYFLGDSGDDNLPAAQISVYVDGTPGVNDMPGRMHFMTTADGSSFATSRLIINSQGVVNIGSNTASPTLFTLTPRFQINGTDFPTAAQLIGRWGNTAGSASINGGKSRGAAVGTHGAVNSGDALLEFNGVGSDGSAFQYAGGFTVAADAAPSAGVVPGRITISTADSGGVGRERIRIDSAGQVSIPAGGQMFIGDATDRGLFGTQVAFQVSGTDLATASYQLGRWSNDANGPGYFFLKSRGATIGSHGVLQDGDVINLNSYYGSDGSNFAAAAILGVKVDGTPSAGNVPGRLYVVTQSNGTLEERARINGNGLAVFNKINSETDYHRVAIRTVSASLTAAAGATITATNLIPDGAIVVGVTTKVTTALGGTLTGYQVGDGTDPDRWGAIVGTAVGTSSDNRDWTATTIQAFTAANNVVLTSVGANFNGTGVIYVSVQYLIGECD